MRTTLVSLAAAFAALTGAAVAAEELTPYEFRLDLAGAQTPEGAARIYGDIRRHAARVCRALETDDGMLNAATRKCRAAVIEEAVIAANAPLVTAEWRGDIAADRVANR